MTKPRARTLIGRLRPRETPLLMCGSMVVATLEDRNTQTRRLSGLDLINENLDDWFLASSSINEEGCVVFANSPNYQEVTHRHEVECPYPMPPARLWVKETHFRWGRWVRNGKTKKGKPAWKFRPAAPNLKKVLYVAGEPVALPEKIKRTELAWHKRPSIFMPRWASRITLEITDVRVERVQSITEADAEAEGASCLHDFDCKSGHSMTGAFHPDQTCNCGNSADKEVYQCLWDSLNAKRGFGWETNPWCWVISFRRINAS